MTAGFVDALKRSVDILGSQAAVASAVGVNQSTISRWLQGKVDWIPYDLPYDLESATLGKVNHGEFYP